MVFNHKLGIREAAKDMVIQAALKYGYSVKKMPGHITSTAVQRLMDRIGSPDSARLKMCMSAKLISRNSVKRNQ